MPPDKLKDEAAVKKWVKTMFKSMGEGDFDKFCSSCTEEVTLYPPNMHPLYGIEAMKKLTKPWFETFDMSHIITEIQVKTDSNTAYAFSQYIDTIIPKKGGNAKITPNKATYILKRELDNSWKATHLIWNRSPPTE